MRQTYFSDDYVESHRRAFNDARSQVIRWQDALARDPQNYELRQRLEHAEQSSEFAQFGRQQFAPKTAEMPPA